MVTSQSSSEPDESVSKCSSSLQCGSSPVFSVGTVEKTPPPLLLSSLFSAGGNGKYQLFKIGI